MADVPYVVEAQDRSLDAPPVHEDAVFAAGVFDGPRRRDAHQSSVGDRYGPPGDSHVERLDAVFVAPGRLALLAAADVDPLDARQGIPRAPRERTVALEED